MAEAVPLDRRRVVRTLTFWLRPGFLLRVAARFQRIAGFDRAIALASSALTAIVPLMIVVGIVSSELGGKSTADRIIDRYELTGRGAEAVRDILAPTGSAATQAGFGIAGVLFLLLAVLSFTRAVQRLFETTWELPPLSLRNSSNGFRWAGGLLVFLGVTGVLQTLGVGRLDLLPALLSVPVGVVFLVWTGRRLSAGRIQREELLPFAVLGAVLFAIASVAAVVYVPHAFNAYTARYGVIGAVFAMISALFVVMSVLVGSAAAGREIRDELQDIRAGRQPPEDEVRRQWEEVRVVLRERWASGTAMLPHGRRGGDRPSEGD